MTGFLLEEAVLGRPPFASHVFSDKHMGIGSRTCGVQAGEEGEKEEKAGQAGVAKG